ncbi:MAG: HEPN domain-containing protein [Sedimentisphaerales bacterium]|nr:HEPN domain-containing protein [Sedimentisphaerales bacterium]
MTPEEQALVQYRLERAQEALEEARLLFDAGHLHTYVNRLYYACFYAMSALLLTTGISTSKHTHLRAVLHREFVRTGTMPLEYGQFFDLLFNNRQKGDYSDLVVFQAEQVAGWLPQAQAFVEYVSGLVSQQL